MLLLKWKRNSSLRLQHESDILKTCDRFAVGVWEKDCGERGMHGKDSKYRKSGF